MHREIVLDTETTGLDCRNGDRLVEVGCVELVNRIPSGRAFHRYINPERDMPAAAEAVHGLSSKFLADKPKFADIVGEFVEFLAGDALVIHNASFDVGFLNAEFERVGRPSIGMDRVTDTLLLARRKHPGGANNLDALCKRYAIDNSRREKHGALMDAELLAEVYVELLGVRQAKLELTATETRPLTIAIGSSRQVPARPRPLAPRLDDDAMARHVAFVKTLGVKAIWLRYSPPEE